MTHASEQSIPTLNEVVASLNKNGIKPETKLLRYDMRITLNFYTEHKYYFVSNLQCLHRAIMLKRISNSLAKIAQ